MARRIPGAWIVASAIVAWSACGGAQTPATPTPASPTDTGSLKAAASGKLVGTAIQAGFLGDTQYRAVLDREFNYITAEYQMKWDAIEIIDDCWCFARVKDVARFIDDSCFDERAANVEPKVLHKPLNIAARGRTGQWHLPDRVVAEGKSARQGSGGEVPGHVAG